MSTKQKNLLNPIIPESYKVLETGTPGISTQYSITFRVTDTCNLKCDYCHWKDGIHYSLNDIKKTIDNIMVFFNEENITSCTFYFHGGEPCFHPDIIEILEYIRTKETDNFLIVIEVQTNLTLKNIDEILPLVNYLCVSLHWHELQRTNNLIGFKENLKKIPIDKRLSLDIMQEPFESSNNLKVFQNYCLELLSEKFKNSEMIHGFCHYSKNNDTLEQHLSFYNKWNQTEQKYLVNGIIRTTNDLFRTGLDCRGMHCSAGKDTIVINGDGNMFVCGIHMTNYTNRFRCNPDEKPYTNIINDSRYILKWRIIRNGYKCRWDYCGGDFYLDRIRK